MKYTNFSELPINAFQPKLGRGPFSYGMTLEGGGGGGGIVGGIVDAVGDVFKGAGDIIGDAAKAVGDVGVQLDKGVNDVVPGGWATVATVAIMVAAPYAAPYLAAEAGAAITAAEAAAALEAAAIAEGATTAGMVAGASSGVTTATVLEAAAINAAKSAAINSATQLAVTGSIDPDQVFKAGITGGVTGGMSNTLSAYDLNPIVSSGISGTVGGGLNAALNDRDVGIGALTGAIGGTAGGVTNMVAKDLDLDPYSTGALKGAASGITSAALNDQNVLTGGLTGAAVGATSVAGRQLGTALENEITGDTDRQTFTGNVLSSLAGSEIRDLLTEDPTRPQRPILQRPSLQRPPLQRPTQTQTPIPSTKLAGAPSQVSYAQPSGALPRASQPNQISAFTPRMSPAGAPIFGNQQSSSSMLSQTGLPSMASTTSNTSDVSLSGGAAGIPFGSSPNANVGNVTGLFPSSGLNAAGLPAPLASGVLTSQAMYDSAPDNPKINQLKQLYPQLENVDPRILTSITSDPPNQTYARGGAVRMNNGGQPQFSNEQLSSYISDIQGKGGGDAEIASAMNQFGVSPEQLSGALGVSTGDIQSRYNAVNPAGQFNTTSPNLRDIYVAGDSWLSDPSHTSNIQQQTGQNVTNVAIGGSKSSDVLDQLNNYISGGGTFGKDSTVMLGVGGNDLLRGVNPLDIENNLNRIASTLSDRNVNLILSGAPNVRSDADITGSSNLGLHPLYQNIANKNKNVRLVDSMPSLLNNKFLVDESGYHMNEIGKNAYGASLSNAYRNMKGLDPINYNPSDISQYVKDNKLTLEQAIALAPYFGLTPQQVQSALPTKMASGGSPISKSGNPKDILERFKKAQEDYEFTQNDRGFKLAAQSLLPPNQDKYAARVPYGDPSSNFNRPISSQYFINRVNGGSATHNPEFITGKTGHFVEGKGDGQSDDIPAMLADGEYVFDADTVAALGNGSSKAGALQLDKMREAIRKHKRSAPNNKIPPKAKSPLEYFKGKA